MNPMEKLVRALSRLPGIGEKSASRLSLFILRDATNLSQELIEALRTVREKVHFCRICQNLTEGDLCSICEDPQRDRSLICVIQEPIDLLMIEKTGEFRGLYHILHGTISPLEGVGPDEIRISSLLKRVKKDGISEIILATNPNPEGETTALYLKKILVPLQVKITRIASGIPVGGTLEYTDSQTLSRALDNRKDF